MAEVRIIASTDWMSVAAKIWRIMLFTQVNSLVLVTGGR